MTTYEQQAQIIQNLKTIDQYGFEAMVNNLLHQGAFPEIVNECCQYKTMLLSYAQVF